ncbi:hypothetical protein AB1N83_011351 [Pleurotus pulmonarius]
MEHYDRSEYRYGYREGTFYQESSYQVAGPSVTMLNDNLAGNLAHPPIWAQSPVTPDVYNSQAVAPPQFYPHDWSQAAHCHRQREYYEELNMVPPALQSPATRFVPQTIISITEAEHSLVKALDSIPHDHDHPPSFDRFDGPQSYSMPFAQRGPTEASTASLPTSRQLATDAVSDAAEKRRVNPHRFFCQYCDRGFTARHNYYRHLGAHNDERPFCCECGSAFTTKSDLKRHKFKSKKHGHGQDYAGEHN